MRTKTKTDGQYVTLWIVMGIAVAFLLYCFLPELLYALGAMAKVKTEGQVNLSPWLVVGMFLVIGAAAFFVIRKTKTA